MLTGVHFEFNTSFGYSLTVGIRIAGLGNPTFAQLAVGAVLLLGLVAARFPSAGPRWLWDCDLTLVALVPPIFGHSFRATLAACASAPPA